MIAYNNNILASTLLGDLLLSVNNGSSWTTLNTGLLSTRILSLASNGSNIFVGTNGLGISISTNNGASWTAVNTGLSKSFIYSLAINGNKVFAGTNGGLFFSVNNGSSWTEFNSGLPITPVYSILVNGNNLNVGTLANGVWSRPLSEFKVSQAITFNSLPDKTLGEAEFSLNASSNSSLPVSFNTTSDKITIAGNKITLLKVGRVTITATQGGNEDYLEATAATQSFCIKPLKPTTITSNINTSTPLLTSSATTGNQWFLNGTAIAGATNPTYTATQTGTYKVQVKADDCASEFSTEQALVVTGIEDAATTSIGLYPNPVTDWLTIALGDDEAVKEVKLYSITGQQLAVEVTTGNSVRFNVAGYDKGIYLAKVQAGELVRVIKFAKE